MSELPGGGHIEDYHRADVMLTGYHPGRKR